MGLITKFLIFFLIISIKTESELDSYSIEVFKEYVKNNGLFEIILSIKMIYGQDVAIISCEELNENCKGNCKRLVLEYMPQPTDPTESNPNESDITEPDTTEPTDPNESDTPESDSPEPDTPEPDTPEPDSPGSDTPGLAHSLDFSFEFFKLHEIPILDKMPFIKLVLSRRFNSNETKLIYDKIIKKIKESKQKI